MIGSIASSHFIFQRDTINNCRGFDKPELVRLGNGGTAIGESSAYAEKLFLVSELKPAVLKNVSYVPRLSCILISVWSAVKPENTVKIGLAKSWIRCHDSKLNDMGKTVQKLHKLSCRPLPVATEKANFAASNDVNIWHQCLLYLNESQLQPLKDKRLVHGIDAFTIKDK